MVVQIHHEDQHQKRSNRLKNSCKRALRTERFNFYPEPHGTAALFHVKQKMQKQAGAQFSGLNRENAGGGGMSLISGEDVAVISRRSFV